MVTGATSLSLVRDELFTTLEDTEHSLEQFIGERNNGVLLQQAVESLQQVRGTLKLIELTGAELLAQEVLQRVTDIPAGAGEERDGQLAALSNALHVLRRYLEQVDARRLEMPELLLPAINSLRKACAQPALPESYFFSVRLDQLRPAQVQAPATVALADLRRLRQMYQLGLLGLIRENGGPGLRLMQRALERFDGLFADSALGRLCWVAAAAVESMAEGRLLPRTARKRLFSRVDREIRQALGNLAAYEAPRSLLKELLYLIALANGKGPQASAVRDLFGLIALPFIDQLLDEEYRRLSGPGQGVMRSLSSAIREELASVKDQLDLVERGTAGAGSYGSLHAQLSRLAKTLGMVGLGAAAQALQQQLPLLARCDDEQPASAGQLQVLAETVLYVEGMVASLERGEQDRLQALQSTPGEDGMAFAAHQLAEARIVVLDEARASLALAKRAITAYLESAGERMHLSNVPLSLDSVRGGLWFLNQIRAAQLVGLCGQYIQQQMVDASQMPSEQMLETLADALSSLEYYLEGGAVLPAGGGPNILDLAEDSVQALGLPLSA